MAANLSINVAALALLFGSGCDSVFEFNSDGQVHVAITTSGSNLDSNGYSVTIDGDLAYVLAAQGSIALQLAQGPHSVMLGGLATNCTVDGDNPRSIVVGPGGSADVSFGVVCERPGRLGAAAAPA
jgi:hypothetical protein